MKPRTWHLFPAVAAGLLIGWLAPRKPVHDSSSRTSETAGREDRARWNAGRRETAHRPSARFSARSAEVREELKHATADRIPGLFKRALQEADQAQRMALLLEIFAAIDDSNVVATLDTFEEAVREIGGDYPHERMLATYLAGQRAGETMMNAWLERGLGDNYRDAHETFWGWCTVDPRAAEAWLERISSDHPLEKNSLMRAVIGGLAIHDPETGIRRLSALEEPIRSTCIGDLGHHLVQGQGLDRGIEWMLQVNRSAEPGDEEFAKRVTDWMFMKVNRSAAGGKGGAETARRLEKIHAELPINEDRLIQSISAMPSIEALELVDHLARGPVLEDPLTRQRIVQFAFHHATSASPSKTAGWLATRPDSPFGKAGPTDTNH